MKILSYNNIPITKSSLNLKYTLVNGQCFNWFPLNHEYSCFHGVLSKYYIKFEERGDNIFYYNYPEDDISKLLDEYF